MKLKPPSFIDALINTCFYGPADLNLKGDAFGIKRGGVPGGGLRGTVVDGNAVGTDGGCIG